MSHPQSATLDGLPKQFVVAMRTLFDIMDDKKTGYVRFIDIEHRWQDDGSKGLPKGVIDSLQKVTPPNGLLSFERFCAGLKICLLRNQVDSNRNHSHRKQLSNASSSSQPVRPPSAPLLDIETTKPSWVSANTATVRPNNAMPQQRTLSMPQLVTERKENTQPDTAMRNYQSEAKMMAVNPKPAPMVSAFLYGPPKPPRTAVGLAMSAVNSERIVNSGNIDKAEIRTALQNWQMGLMLNDEVARTMGEKRLVYAVTDGRPSSGGRGSGDGKPSAVLDQVGIPHKKSTVRRREPRRHTLQNGIDYNMLKRMKQIEQEKDVLLLGLQAIDRTRDWYLKQVAAVQEKMRYLGRMGSHLEHWTEAQQERLELQRARVLEVNRHLATLTDSWERGGLPLHMNLAVHHPVHHGILARLKQQNHQLTDEVSKKSERITALEREKTSLIRELFQSRTKNRRGMETQEDVPFL